MGFEQRNTEEKKIDDQENISTVSKTELSELENIADEIKRRPSNDGNPVLEFIINTKSKIEETNPLKNKSKNIIREYSNVALDTICEVFDGTINPRFKKERKEFRKDLYEKLTTDLHYPKVKAKIISSLSPLLRTKYTKLAHAGLLAYNVDGIPKKDFKAIVKAADVDEDHAKKITVVSRYINSFTNSAEVYALSIAAEKGLEAIGMPMENIGNLLFSTYLTARAADCIWATTKYVKDKEYVSSPTMYVTHAGWIIAGALGVSKIYESLSDKNKERINKKVNYVKREFENSKNELSQAKKHLGIN